MFDKDIAIINKIYTNGILSYVVSHVKGFWSSNNSISINGVDLVKSKGAIVRILMSETGYVEPNSYSGIGWTLKNDDYIVKGGTDITTVSAIKDIISTYECLKITNVAIKDYGSSDMQHFEVSGE